MITVLCFILLWHLCRVWYVHEGMSEKQPQIPELHWRGGGRPWGPAWLTTTVVLDCIWNERIIYFKIQLQIRKMQIYLRHIVESRQAFYQSFFLSKLGQKCCTFSRNSEIYEKNIECLPGNHKCFVISIIS